MHPRLHMVHGYIQGILFSTNIKPGYTACQKMVAKFWNSNWWGQFQHQAKMLLEQTKPYLYNVFTYIVYIMGPIQCVITANRSTSIYIAQTQCNLQQLQLLLRFWPQGWWKRHLQKTQSWMKSNDMNTHPSADYLNARIFLPQKLL